MKTSIEGPDCTDPEKCHGDCCSIKIDVPKVLAEWYIKRGYAKESDFTRSDIFSFHLRFDESTGKCFLFDKDKNGCLVHDTGRKPPQCWIYPTGFSALSNKSISCKRSSGWRILNLNKTKEAEQLLEIYVFLCQIEAMMEHKNIKKRVNSCIPKGRQNEAMGLYSSLKAIPPCSLGGIKDGWDSVEILPAEGYSLQMKKFCKQYNSTCEFLLGDFLKCEQMCDKIIRRLIMYLDEHILGYVRKNGADSDGEYSLFKLFSKNF